MGEFCYSKYECDQGKKEERTSLNSEKNVSKFEIKKKREKLKKKVDDYLECRYYWLVGGLSKFRKKKMVLRVWWKKMVKSE